MGPKTTNVIILYTNVLLLVLGAALKLEIAVNTVNKSTHFYVKTHFADVDALVPIKGGSYLFL